MCLGLGDNVGGTEESRLCCRIGGLGGSRGRLCCASVNSGLTQVIQLGTERDSRRGTASVGEGNDERGHLYLMKI